MFVFSLFNIECTMNKFMKTSYSSGINYCFNRPAYASNILIELYKTSDNKYSISLKYEG